MPILNKDWPGWRKAKTRKKLLATLSADEIAALYWHWPFWARPDQLPPPGQWVSWLMLGGRGAGKTRAGAEWVRQRVEADARHIALIGETYHEARAVMVEGPSGLLAISPPHNRPRFLPSRHLLQWPNGAQARLFSSERPEALRGPQFDTAWCDELAKWRRDEETWDMLQFGLRLGREPQQMITTTPRPTALLKRLIDDPTCVLTRAATLDNRANLAPGFIDHVVGRYVGTALGRQELDGDLIDDQPGALWQREIFESCRVTHVPPLQQTIIALDPPVSSGPKADACGIIIIGLGQDGRAYVLEDRSVRGLSPAQWAGHVRAAYRQHAAAALVGEVNQGGELVREIVLRDAPDIHFCPVRAVTGKLMRAEPVTALYERGRVLHCGRFDALEDEMCRYVGHGRSPDRLDALVWGVSWLLLRPPRQTPPRMRRL